MDFTKYEIDVEYPKSPKKPSIAKGATAEQARKYADDLEVYEKEFEEFEAKQKAYYARIEELRCLFFKDAFEQEGIPANHPKIDILRTIAWYHGHSSGYSEVYYWICELSELLDY